MTGAETRMNPLSSVDKTSFRLAYFLVFLLCYIAGVPYARIRPDYMVDCGVFRIKNDPPNIKFISKFTKEI
jgi:hypothetical protein